MTQVEKNDRQQAQPGSLLVQPLDDFEDFHYLFGKWGGQFQQTSRGVFQGEARVYRGERLRAFLADTNQAIFTRGLDKSDFVTVIPITPQNAGTRWRGRRLSIGQLLVKGPDVEYYNQTARNTVIRAALVPVVTIIEMAGPLANLLIGRFSLSAIGLNPSLPDIQRFQGSLEALLDPDVPGRARAWQDMEQECLDRLANCLAVPRSNASADIMRIEKFELLNKALDIMNARLQQSLDAAGLCERLGAHDRLLRRVFKEAFGMGPMAFFRYLRLNHVRRAFMAGRGTGAKVSDIAAGYGFRRAGAFATDYRQLFGESPSRTLGVRGYPGVQAQGREPGSR